MGFKDVAFLSSRASFHTTFHENCGRDEMFWSASCLRTWFYG